MKNEIKTTELTDSEFEAIINNTLNNKTYIEGVSVSGKEFSFCR